MAEFPGGDKLHITLEGPPRLVNGSEVPGDKFFLAGDRAKQAKEGVELARGVSGILRPVKDYRYDTSANQPGSTFVSAIGSRRTIQTAINVFGDTPKEFRANWRRWILNNPTETEAKLWFETSDAPKRYAYVRPDASAGMSSLDIDPNIYGKIEGLEWGWESDYPYLFGETEVVPYNSNGVASGYNPSDVASVYPKIYLHGPGSFKVGGITTPTLTADETVRINFDPMRRTYVKRNNTTGQVVNLWYTLAGKRPELKLPMYSNFSHKITLPSTTAKAELEFTPLFRGAI